MDDDHHPFPMPARRLAGVVAIASFGLAVTLSAAGLSSLSETVFALGYFLLIPLILYLGEEFPGAAAAEGEDETVSETARAADRAAREETTIELSDPTAERGGDDGTSEAGASGAGAGTGEVSAASDAHTAAADAAEEAASPEQAREVETAERDDGTEIDRCDDEVDPEVQRVRVQYARGEIGEAEFERRLERLCGAAAREDRERAVDIE